MSDNLLIGLVSIIAFGVGAQWIAWRTKLPAILLLLLAGLLAGPVLGVLNPDVLMGDLLGPFISVSVGIILFEGGLSLKFSELKEIGGAVTRLVSFGVVITLAIASISAHYLFGLSAELAVLLGAILVVTGPTVIIPLLTQVRPTTQVSNLLKWEGIVIDPIGAMLAVLVFEVIFTSSFSEATGLAFLSIGKTIFFGTIIGLAGAALVYFLLSRYRLPDQLQNPVNLMVVIIVFAASHLLKHESGLWATTVMGIALANQKSARIHHIVEFKENLRVLLLSALFILLAARVEFADLINALNWQVAAFLAILIFIARPLAVYLSTVGSNLSWREKLFTCWMAPRGVVAASIASLFAIELVNYGYEEANSIVPIVFITIIATVAIYGLTAKRVANWLDVAKPSPNGFLIVGAHTWARKLAVMLKNEGLKILIADSNRSNIRRARTEELETYHGNVLAEYAVGDLHLDGIGKLLALTSNDEVNSLTAIRFSDIFSSSHVFQLPVSTTSDKDEREVHSGFSGRMLFEKSLTFETVSKLISQNYSFEKIEITKNLSREEFNQKFEEDRIPLFLLTGNNDAIPYTLENIQLPKTGDKVIFLQNPDSSQKDLTFPQDQKEETDTHSGEKQLTEKMD